jgi:hypothetical protein
VTRKRRGFAELADELALIADRPENRDRQWDWLSIGLALGINATTAQHLVYWMRKNYAKEYWTVGTARSDYMIVPTKSFREALDGILNQQRHLITRLQSMQASAATLAAIDPSPEWSALAARTEKYYMRRIGDEQEFREVLVGFRE